jgi:hypothetical protein
MDDDIKQISASTRHRDFALQQHEQQEMSPHKAHPMHFKKLVSLAVTLLAGAAFLFLSLDRGRAEDRSAAQLQSEKAKARSFDDQISANAESMMEEGRQTFRFDTFGDEAFWGDLLQLCRGPHTRVAGSAYR